MITEKKFHKSYETDRLILSILNETQVDDVLTFLNRGASVFDEYENEKPADFYTRSLQRKIIHAEYNMAVQKTGVRFWIFQKGRPHEIIGTVSFSFYRSAPFQSIMVGYKLLPNYWHKGYATEAIAGGMQVVHDVMQVRRVEAFVLSENIPSQKVLSRLGFKLEGTAYQCLEVQGIRRDHLQYSFIFQ